MTILEPTQVDEITLTSSAAQAAKDLMEKRNLSGYALRVYISGGGCSGYQYGMALDDNIRELDTVVETDGVKLIIDEVSIEYLRGATIDYVDQHTGSGFKIHNPNAAASCGCGQPYRNAGDSGSSSTGNCNGCN